MDDQWNLDLHKCNIAFEVPALDGKPEENAMMALGVPQCVPVITRDHKHQMDSHPKYLVIPGSLVEYVKLDDMRVKIIDLGEGSLSPSKSCRRTLNFRSILQQQ